MSYTPTEWSSGDLITAERLNKMENGIAGSGGAYIVNAVTNAETGIVTLDKTFLEIETAYLAGKPVFIYRTILTLDNPPVEVYNKNLVVQVVRSPNTSEIYYAIYTSGESTDEFFASSLDAYPSYDPNY